MDGRHTWMVEKLTALEEFAHHNDWVEVASLLRIARRTTVGDLRSVSRRLSRVHQKHEEHWFETVIDQLARHANDYDMPNVEKHLADARAAWDLSISDSSDGYERNTENRSH